MNSEHFNIFPGKSSFMRQMRWKSACPFHKWIQRNPAITFPKLYGTLHREMGWQVTQDPLQISPQEMLPGGTRALRPLTQEPGTCWCRNFPSWLPRLYLRKMLESARRDLLFSKSWAQSKHLLRKGSVWLFYRQRDWGREGKWQGISAEPGKNSDFQIPSPCRWRDWRWNPSFKSPFNSKQPGETNRGFGKACVMSDQTLPRVHLTDISISKMPKHAKDREVKIKSQVSWRKLSGLKTEEREKEKEPHAVSLADSRHHSGQSLASVMRFRQPPCRGLRFLSCSLQNVQWRNLATAGPESVGRGCWDGESPWDEIHILGRVK